MCTKFAAEEKLLFSIKSINLNWGLNGKMNKLQLSALCEFFSPENLFNVSIVIPSNSDYTYWH